MLQVPINVANTETDSALVDMATVLGTNQELEDYVICGLITPAGLEATAASLLFGLDDETPLPYYDGAGAAVPIVVAASQAIRLKASDYPFTPPFVGIHLGTAVSNEGGRTLILLLAKR